MDLKEMQKAVASRLTDEEVATLESAIRARRSMGMTASKAESATVRLPPEELMMLEAIADFMSYAGADASSAAMLAKTSNFPAFRKKVPPVMEILKRSNLTRTETRAVLRLGVSLLHEKLVAQGVDTTSRRMMDHIHRLPAQLDQHFPGYGMGGYLKLTVRAHTPTADEDENG